MPVDTVLTDTLQLRHFVLGVGMGASLGYSLAQLRERLTIIVFKTPKYIPTPQKAWDHYSLFNKHFYNEQKQLNFISIDSYTYRAIS
jgi:hypothetical protein